MSLSEDARGERTDGDMELIPIAGLVIIMNCGFPLDRDWIRRPRENGIASQFRFFLRKRKENRSLTSN